MTDDVARYLVAAGLVVLAGVFACAETAISRISRVRAQGWLSESRRGARSLLTVAEDPTRYVNVLLLLRAGSELTATVLVAVTLVTATDTGVATILLAAAVMTVVSYIGIGVAPRTVGVQRDEFVALIAAAPVVALTRVLGPLPKLLILVGNALTPGRGFPGGPFATEAELRSLVDLAEQRQVIEEGERRMIHSVFDLSDTLVREVMVPRTDIVFIEKGKTVKQAQSLALRSGFSRIPVVGDGADDVVGVVYLKDVVRRMADGKDDQRVEEAMRPPVYVPDSKPADELLREMQTEQTHMAIVIDEYGGTAGLVTIEDVLEEIVGEIADEYDREAPAVEELPDGGVRVTARFPVDEVAERFGVELAVDGVDTVAGLMARELGRVPIPGSSVVLAGLTFTAESPTGRRNRVGTVSITRDPTLPTRSPRRRKETARP